jgi:hypothetical protein
MNVGTMPEIFQWIQRSRDSEHFLVNTLLISLISMIVAWHELRRDKPQPTSPGDVATRAAPEK